MRLETIPHHWADDLPWLLLDPTYDALSGKTSHFWHYRKYRRSVSQPTYISPDKTAGDRTRGGVLNVFVSIAFSDWLWRNVAILVPVEHTGPYQIGYISFEGGKWKTELCALVLNGATAVQLGPAQTWFFAVDLNGNQVELCVYKEMTKKELWRQFGRKITLI